MPQEKLYYSTIETVKHTTGIRPDDIGFSGQEASSDEELDTWIENRLVEVKDLIDQHRNRDYHEESKIPPGIHLIALRVMTNFIRFIQQARQSPISNHQEHYTAMVTDKLITESIDKDLKRYPAKLDSGFRMTVVKKKDD